MNFLINTREHVCILDYICYTLKYFFFFSF